MMDFWHKNIIVWVKEVGVPRLKQSHSRIIAEKRLRISQAGVFYFKNFQNNKLSTNVKKNTKLIIAT